MRKKDDIESNVVPLRISLFKVVTQGVLPQSPNLGLVIKVLVKTKTKKRKINSKNTKYMGIYYNTILHLIGNI